MTTTRTRGTAKLRWAYLVLLGFALAAAAIMLTMTLGLAKLEVGEPLAWPMLTGCVLAVSAWVCAFAALGYGLAALGRGDIVRPRAGTAIRLSRSGGFLAGVGALLVPAIGAVEHLLGVEEALLVGLLYGASCLLPALVNHRVQRLAAATVTPG